MPLGYQAGLEHELQASLSQYISPLSQGCVSVTDQLVLLRGQRGGPEEQDIGSHAVLVESVNTIEITHPEKPDFR